MALRMLRSALGLALEKTPRNVVMDPPLIRHSPFTRRAKAKKEEIEEEEEEEEEEERRERKTVKSQDSLTGSTQSDWVSLGFARVLSSSDNGFSKVIIRVA